MPPPPLCDRRLCRHPRDHLDEVAEPRLVAVFDAASVAAMAEAVPAAAPARVDPSLGGIVGFEIPRRAPATVSRPAPLRGSLRYAG